MLTLAGLRPELPLPCCSPSGFCQAARRDSRQQLAETIEKWGKAMAVERFFADAEERLINLDNERRQRLEERLKLARAMMGSIDPLDFIENWRAPDERYRSKYREE